MIISRICFKTGKLSVSSHQGRFTSEMELTLSKSLLWKVNDYFVKLIVSITSGVSL